MAANHERVLWIVDQYNRFSTTVLRSYVFRSRDNAREFQENKNKRSKTFIYTEPQRAVWGPE